MNNFTTKYEKILEILKQFETKSNFLNQKSCPRLSDIELISVDLTAESLSIDSEYQLFRTLPESLSSKIERSVYNRRRRKLFFVKVMNINSIYLLQIRLEVPIRKNQHLYQN